MKCILLISITLMSCVFTAPLENDGDATIISYEYEQKENGYFFSYTTSNGITREENAVIIDDPNGKNDENQIIRVNGYYSYTDKDNNLYRVDYVADENGYRIVEKPKPPSTQTATQGLSISLPAYKPQVQKGISSAALASLGGS